MIASYRAWSPAGYAALSALTVLGFASPATARNYDISFDASNIGAIAVHQPAPEYPESGVRRGQEAWVRVNFVLTPDGMVVDPIFVDSSGGAAFEQSVRKVMTHWRFEPQASGDELPNNTVEIRFQNSRVRNSATRNFLRHYREIARCLARDDIGAARKQVDSARRFGGWNLYEATMLSLMIGRVEAAEGDYIEQLANYRRALSVSDQASLNGKGKRDVLQKIFELEFDANEFAAALATLDMLRAEPNSDKVVETLEDKAARIERLIASDLPLSTHASIGVPCDCDGGQAMWTHQPVRRSFSFEDLSGNVDRFEARCDNRRISDKVSINMKWSLPEEWRSCRIFVFGEDGATFQYVEHSALFDDAGAGRAIVARGDVLD